MESNKHILSFNIRFFFFIIMYACILSLKKLFLCVHIFSSVTVTTPSPRGRDYIEQQCEQTDGGTGEQSPDIGTRVLLVRRPSFISVLKGTRILNYSFI